MTVTTMLYATLTTFLAIMTVTATDPPVGDGSVGVDYEQLAQSAFSDYFGLNTTYVPPDVSSQILVVYFSSFDTPV